MPGKPMSGHCRFTVLCCLLVLAFCTAGVAGAATLNQNLVVSRITQLETLTVSPVYAVCPSGYDCLTDADAQSQLGSYTKYSDAVCGYKQNTATAVAVVRVPQYCVKKADAQYPAICPEGCTCMMESDAKAKFGSYSRCGSSPCYTVVTGSAQINAYCFRQGVAVTTTTPVPCPEGCTCLSDTQAKDRYGTYTRCTDTVCGYDIPANAVSAYQIPRYCVKPGTTSSACPEGCNCISEAVAKNRYGTYTKCSENTCGYEQDQTPEYCIRQAPVTPSCPEGCSCISEAAAKEKGGTWTRCSGTACGYEQSTATVAAVVSIPKYCMKQQGSTPACPDGCTCIADDDARQKGLADRCDSSQTPCGYKAAATTANQQIPMYCYKLPVTATPVCPQGCSCLQEADAKLKFGANSYTRCSADICGYDPSATTANGIPKYCFRPAITPSTPVCPDGCACVTNGTAAEKKLSPCGGNLVSCGYDANKQPLYCYGEAATPSCTYDYQKNTCTGTCSQGYSCSIRALKKDESGKIVYADCGCSAPASTPCTYDPQKNSCTGSCQTGAACAIVGRQVDEKTGAVTPVCGCPQQSACTYNYDKEACTGTCPATGDACQVNSLYRDPATGKVIRADCQCKGAGDTCTCDAEKGACTGTCANGQACTITERSSDVAGAVVCKSCGCASGCTLTSDNQCSGTCATGAPCTRSVTKDDSGQEKVSCGCGDQQPGTPVGTTAAPQGLFESIGNFFHRLFGGK